MKSLRRQAINSWIKAYRDWQITEDELLVGLTLVVDSRTLAAAMVDAEKLRIRPEPEPPVPPPPDPLVVRSRNQAIASWVKLFRDGEITIEQLDLGLTPLIVDPEIRNLVIELENLRARPTPDLIPVDEEDPDLARAREDAIAAHLGLFRDRRISLSQLYAYLMADGLTPEVAEATAITEANKRIQIPPIESLYYKLDVIRPLIDQGLEAYALLFQTGQITLDAFREHLTALGVDPDLALYLMDLEELRAFLEKL